MSDPLAELLIERPLLVLDGALATELERRGADLSDPLWSAKCLLERPDLVRAVHLDYFKAGADVATTATYQATFEGFHGRGIERDAAARVMLEAAALAAEARDEYRSQSEDPRRRLIAASVGPYGAMLADGSEYRGRYAVNDRELAAFHRPRLEVLSRSGADLLACETIPCLREARVLAELLEEFPAITAWISFSCKDGAHNSEGEQIADCAAALHDYARVAAVGVNCTPPGFVVEVLRRLGEETDKPLVAYPNSGQRYDALTKQWIGPHTEMAFAQYAHAWQSAGARLIGGCCGTTPAHVRELSQACKGAPVRRG